MDLVAGGERIGNFHLYIGQEATGGPILELAEADDYLLTHHRNHGHVIGRGADAGRAFAELLGRESGLLGGRGGGLHLGDPSMGFLQTSAILGGAISLATGAAFGITRSGGGRVAIGFFGDGSLEEGIAYEALNLAALWKLPVIFVCENNTPGAKGTGGGGSPISVHAAKRLTAITDSLGISSYEIDGSDVSAVYACVSEARQNCLNNKGPVFIEAQTTRWPGSQGVIPKSFGATDIRVGLGEADPSGEDADWIVKHDPLPRYVRGLVSEAVMTRDEILALDKEISAEILAGSRFALASAYPDPSTVLDRIFA